MSRLDSIMVTTGQYVPVSKRSLQRYSKKHWYGSGWGMDQMMQTATTGNLPFYPLMAFKIVSLDWSSTDSVKFVNMCIFFSCVLVSIEASSWRLMPSFSFRKFQEILFPKYYFSTSSSIFFKNSSFVNKGKFPSFFYLL